MDKLLHCRTPTLSHPRPSSESLSTCFPEDFDKSTKHSIVVGRSTMTGCLSNVSHTSYLVVLPSFTLLLCGSQEGVLELPVEFSFSTDLMVIVREWNTFRLCHLDHSLGYFLRRYYQAEILAAEEGQNRRFLTAHYSPGLTL